MQFEDLPIIGDLLMMDAAISLTAAILSLIIGAAGYALYRVHFYAPASRAPFRERLEDLTKRLAESSRDVDEILSEMTTFVKNHAAAVQQLDKQLLMLEQKERVVTDRIKHLEAVPLPVADHMAKIVDIGDKRSARRDYVLFALGAVVSTIISILLRA